MGILAAYMPTEQDFERKRRFADEGVMQELADGTGGTFFHNDNGLFEGLRRLTSRPEHVYILGFAPHDAKPGSLHQLKVTVRRAGFHVQARRGYVSADPDAAPNRANEGLSRAAAAIFSREEFHELPVGLKTRFESAGSSKVHLSISARIDQKGLHHRKIDGLNSGTVLVMGAVYDRAGNYVAGRQRTANVKVTDASLEGAGADPMTVDLTLDLISGSYMVRLVVVDLGAGAISALTNELVIP
jgi:hypothetical protein